jgi:5'-3' exonuclease
MGVEGSTKILGEGSSVVLSQKNGVIIDTSLLTYQLGKGHCSTSELIRNSEGDTMTSCFKMLEFILTWLNKYVIESYSKGDGCIVPIFVFDGRASKNKKSTIKKRKDKQGTALKKLDKVTEKIRSTDSAESSTEEFTDMLCHSNHCVDHNRHRARSVSFKSVDEETKEQYAKHLRNSYNPGNEIVYIRLLLTWMGIPFIESPSEGDAQCAALSVKLGMGTITADIDIILLGGESIYKFDNIRHLLLREYRMIDIIQDMKKRLLNIIRKCVNDSEMSALSFMNGISDHNGNLNVDFNLDDLRGICCLLGTDYCPGLKIDRSKIGIDAAILLYFQNGRDIRKVLEYVRDHRIRVIAQMTRLGFMDESRSEISKFPRITEQYIERMVTAYNQYNAERVYDPPTDITKISEPNIASLIGFCSTFLNRESIAKVVDIVKRVRETYLKYSVDSVPHDVTRKVLTDPTLPPKSMFGNFGSYHRRCDRISRSDQRSDSLGDSRSDLRNRTDKRSNNRNWRAKSLVERCDELAEVTIQPRYIGCNSERIRCSCN